MVIIFILFSFLWASPAPKEWTMSPLQLQQALREDHLQTIKQMGPEGYVYLKNMSLSSQESLERRWQAILAMAKIGGAESRQDMIGYLQSSTWFLRSAALLGLSLIEKDRGVSFAKKQMQKDPALLVRATALQILSQQKDVDRLFLWKELFNPINFYKGRSLSLRESILKILIKDAQPNEKNRFFVLLKENNPEIKKIAKIQIDRFEKKK